MDIADINVVPNNCPGLILQGGHSLEDYLEEFINISHCVTCDDLTLMDGFWCGLNEDVRFLMPKGCMLEFRRLHQFRSMGGWILLCHLQSGG